MPFLLPAAHQVKTVFGDHPVEFGHFVRVVLEVGVHGNDHLALGGAEALVQRWALAVVAAHSDPLHAGVGLGESQDLRPRAVLAAIVHQQDLVAHAHAADHLVQAGGELGQRFALVQQGNDDGEFHWALRMCGMC